MFILYFLLMSSSAADPLFAKIKEGEVAPWSGRIFNDEAVTQFIVNDKFKVEQCNIQIEYEVQKSKAYLELEHQKKILSLETQNQILNDKILLRDNRIHRLESLKTPPNPFWYTVGGILIGTSMTIGIAHAVNVN
jgi:hypothetical protein